MKKTISIILAALLASSAVSCARLYEAGADSDGDKLSVVATSFPVYDFVREIGGDNVSISLLIDPGTEIHNFEPTAKDMVTVSECDVFLYVGGESESWVETILDSVENSIKTVRLFDCVEAREEETVEGMESGEEEHEHEHEHEGEVEYDEHIWTSPKNAELMCKEIATAMCEADAQNKSLYNERLEDYIAKLEELDGEFRSIVEESENPYLCFGDRFPFLYLVKEYGIEYCAAFKGCSTDSDASVTTITFLADKIKSENLPVIFYIEMSSHKIADMLSEETGAKTLMLHSCQNVTSDEFQSGQTYYSLMKQNAVNLREAIV